MLLQVYDWCFMIYFFSFFCVLSCFFKYFRFSTSQFCPANIVDECCLDLIFSREFYSTYLFFHLSTSSHIGQWAPTVSKHCHQATAVHVLRWLPRLHQSVWTLDVVLLKEFPNAFSRCFIDLSPVWRNCYYITVVQWTLRSTCCRKHVITLYINFWLHHFQNRQSRANNCDVPTNFIALVDASRISTTALRYFET